eukprot:40379-Chlamydomonas_euryale.AAC.2
MADSSSNLCPAVKYRDTSAWPASGHTNDCPNGLHANQGDAITCESLAKVAWLASPTWRQHLSTTLAKSLASKAEQVFHAAHWLLT